MQNNVNQKPNTASTCGSFIEPLWTPYNHLMMIEKGSKMRFLLREVIWMQGVYGTIAEVDNFFSKLRVGFPRLDSPNCIFVVEHVSYPKLNSLYSIPSITAYKDRVGFTLSADHFEFLNNVKTIDLIEKK